MAIKTVDVPIDNGDLPLFCKCFTRAYVEFVSYDLDLSPHCSSNSSNKSPKEGVLLMKIRHWNPWIADDIQTPRPNHKSLN